MAIGWLKEAQRRKQSRLEALALQRSNVVRYVAANPGSTSAEIARGLGLRSQNVGQILHKNDRVQATIERRGTRYETTWRVR